MSERESAPEPDAKPAAKAEHAPAAKATNWSRIRRLLMEAEQIQSAGGRTLTPDEAMEIVQAARSEGIPMAELIEFVNANASAATAEAVRQAAAAG